VADVFESLDLLRERLVDVRARLPTFPPGSVGNAVFSTGRYYQQDVRLHFDPALTQNIRTWLNAAGRWVNEAAVVFLIATLLDHGVLKDSEAHRRDVEGYEHVNIARTLRSIILKEGGPYKPEEPHHRKNMEMLTTP
jgi:hypothetical protein